MELAAPLALPLATPAFSCVHQCSKNLSAASSACQGAFGGGNPNQLLENSHSLMGSNTLGCAWTTQLLTSKTNVMEMQLVTSRNRAQSSSQHLSLPQSQIREGSIASEGSFMLCFPDKNMKGSVLTGMGKQTESGRRIGSGWARPVCCWLVASWPEGWLRSGLVGLWSVGAPQASALGACMAEVSHHIVLRNRKTEEHKGERLSLDRKILFVYNPTEQGPKRLTFLPTLQKGAWHN